MEGSPGYGMEDDMMGDDMDGYGQEGEHFEGENMDGSQQYGAEYGDENVSYKKFKSHQLCFITARIRRWYGFLSRPLVRWNAPTRQNA